MVFHSKYLFLSIEKAERLNAWLILLFAVQIDFYAEIFVRKEQYELQLIVRVRQRCCPRIYDMREIPQNGNKKALFPECLICLAEH